MTNQLLVLGWDAATRSHLDRFDLDFFNSLPHGGTLLPEPYWQSREVDSGTAWTTITTGLSMWEHRVAMLGGTIGNEHLFRAFSSVDHVIPRNLFGRPARIWARSKIVGDQPTNNDIPFKRVWHYVPSSLAFTVPLTYPPKPTDGVTISGFPSPEVAVQPPELEEWVRERYSGEPRKFDHEGAFREEYISELFETHYDERELVIDLDDERDFDHHFIVFTLLDRLLHATDDEEIILEAYELIDETSKILVDAINPDDVIVISDHGMRYNPRGKWVHIHDETTGIWAGTAEFNLETHLDVTPTIADYYGVSMDDHEYTAPASVTDEDALREQLNDLGYL